MVFKRQRTACFCLLPFLFIDTVADTSSDILTCCISAGKSSVYQEPDDYFNGQAIYADIVAMGANVPVVEQNDYHYALRTAIGTAITNATQAGGGSDLATEIQAAQDDIERQMSL